MDRIFSALSLGRQTAGRRRMLAMLRRFARSLPEDMSDEEKASMTAEMARRLERELDCRTGKQARAGED